MYLATTVLILFINFYYTASKSCLSFNNINMLLYEKNGKKFHHDVNGCITRTEFENTTVVKAYVNNQPVSKLGRDSVRHMKYLSIVSFRNCPVEEILPVAFRNVPILTTIEISFGKLQLIPQGVFNYNLTPQLELLKMDHNQINFIEDRSFQNLSNLKNIQLNNNKLVLWKSEWFEDTNSLEVLNFSFNNIAEIPSRAFITFNNLQEIHFDHNDIAKINPDAFKGVRNLTYLGLSHNRLTVLSDTSFPNTLRISYFTLHANYLTSISNKVLQKLAAVEVTLEFNPWTCPCLDRLNYWLYIKNGKTKALDECGGSHIPVCVVPKDTEACIDKFDHEAMLRYINIIKTINMSTPIPLNCVTFQ